MTKRLPLPKRFNVAMTEEAYANLRKLHDEFGYGNNYLLTFLLENFEDVIDRTAYDNMMAAMKEEYGAPAPSGMKKA